MKTPKPVGHAVLALWSWQCILVINAVVQLIAKNVSFSQFILYISCIAMVSAMICKIEEGSNLARLIYLGFNTVAIVYGLAHPGRSISVLDDAVSWVSIPVTLGIFVCLFHDKSAPFFGVAASKPASGK